MKGFKSTHSAKGSTRGTLGAPTGDECVATVQAIRLLAGLPLIAGGTISVDNFRAALGLAPPNNSGTLLGEGQAGQNLTKAGDYVIQGDGYPGLGPAAGRQHIGICENDGCTLIISKSSSNESLTWEETPQQFMDEYTPVRQNGYWRPTK